MQKDCDPKHTENNRIPLDTYNVPFSKPSFWLSGEEYGKITSEINQLYYSQYQGKPICTHLSFDAGGYAYIYWFENHGFNNYNIFLRVPDDH